MKIHEYNEMMAYLTRPARVAVRGGGQIIGKPGGLVEPGVTNYAEETRKQKWERLNPEKVRASKYRYFLKNIKADPVTGPRAQMNQAMVNKAMELNEAITTYNQVLTDAVANKNMQGTKEFKSWLKETYTPAKAEELHSFYHHQRKDIYGSVKISEVLNLQDTKIKLAKQLVKEANDGYRWVRSGEILYRIGAGGQSTVKGTQAQARGKVSKALKELTLESPQDKARKVFNRIIKNNEIIPSGVGPFKDVVGVTRLHNNNLILTIANDTGIAPDIARKGLHNYKPFEERRDLIRSMFSMESKGTSFEGLGINDALKAVSYTHLTLPTKRIV